MKKFKWAFRLTFAMIVGSVLFYTLPFHDVVRVTNTYNRLTTVGAENSWAYASPDSGTAESDTTRDIRFIEAAYPDGSVTVFRNEDTGWVWPPYFKYDSSNLQAEAGNLKSLKETPIWVNVTYYGLRLPILSIYPNAVNVYEVSGPDVKTWPIVSGLVIAMILLSYIMIGRVAAQLYERKVEPLVARVTSIFQTTMGETTTGKKKTTRQTGYE